MQSLFKDEDLEANRKRPLADLLRPKNMAEIIGQDHLVGSNGIIKTFLDKGHIPSLILWGAPGCGKTTMAKAIANEVDYNFEVLSAVTNGTADLKKIFEKAKMAKAKNVETILMIDEIHRFNRAQQDVLLPFVEDGTVVLIGATTENPSFELNNALLSRCRVLTLNSLSKQDLLQIMQRAEDISDKKLPLTDDAKSALANIVNGDARYLLNMCEGLFVLGDDKIYNESELPSIIQKNMPLYDKHQDAHYNLISALHKSLRGSDVDAALYWFARMLDGGEDPLYIARRLVRFAVEDVGLADPAAIRQAVDAKESYQFLGSPEGELALAQAVVYLATAPKSNSVYKAYNMVRKDAANNGSLMPPKHILNAPTKMMKEMGYGKGYKYDHEEEDGFSGQNYFPEDMLRQKYYQPIERGFEREVKKRVEYWDRLREKKS